MRMPGRSACSQQLVWTISLTTGASTSVLLGFAIAVSTSSTTPALHPTCETIHDPMFWQQLTQLSMHCAILLCLVSPAVRPHTRDRIRLPGRPWFFTAVACSALFRVVSVVCYAAACWNPGWTAAMFMEWIADVALLGAAAQLAGGIARSSRHSGSAIMFTSRSATPSGAQPQPQQQQT
ncbi:uncharacterized protein PG998_007806 [Apiospora kogelbergensis]|uniref:Uncharacterized protein n=1 Tax=Apiospora kogelbergensis TaxID=1337665 RepID=A0AAW0QMY5_9PEZI